MPKERQVLRLYEVQRMMKPQGALIITSDEEMEQLERNPAMKARAFGQGMVEIAESLKGIDDALVNVAYDFFFGGDQRRYFPTSPQCIRTFKKLHDVARERGVGFGASVLSPLDLGPAYRLEKGRGGQSHQFQEGMIRPDGSYSVPLRIQRQWFHNKGPVSLQVNRLHAFAFREQRIEGTACYAVDPEEILDVSASAKLTVDETSFKKSGAGYACVNGTISGKAINVGDRDRILVVAVYDVGEMDYFHPDALPYLQEMLDTHRAAGIVYDSFYSDEMHIQFDWDLGTHFGPTEIDTRYITPGLVERYCALHGKRYADFEKYLVYFAFAQHGFLNHGSEPEMAQHVFGPGDADIYATWKFRRDYHRLLTDTVVDLFLAGKRYGEKIFGRKRIWTRAHATWQESPTCDHTHAAWAPEGTPHSRYDYTPSYEWSSSIRENISACYDYFRWGDFLTGMGNDHPEGGYIDRNYYGAALACSFGNFNEVPYSYWGHWGAPAPVSQRVADAAAVFGLGGHMWNCGYVQNWEHRETPVLALYPLDLNHNEERYGSWMVQYGYCDYLTQEKLAEWGRVTSSGNLKVKSRQYPVLLVEYEPMVSRRLMRLIRQMISRGGTVVWTGPPAAIYREDGSDAGRDWISLFGISRMTPAARGLSAQDATITFTGPLADVPAYRILTNLLVDRIYPVEAGKGTEAAGHISSGDAKKTIATLRQTASGGRLVYLGARPRDDQSGSTPDAPRTLFHLFRVLGAYSQDGTGWPEYLSNTSELLACRFPNGAISVTHQYYKVQENWSGGFFRQQGEKFDESVLPPSHLSLRNWGPDNIGYEGERVLTYRLSNGKPVAFSGAGTCGISVGGREYRFSDVPVQITFTPLPKKQLMPSIKQAWFVQVSGGSGDLKIRLPFALPEGFQAIIDPKGNGRGPLVTVAAASTGEGTELTLTPDQQGVPIFILDCNYSGGPAMPDPPPPRPGEGPHPRLETAIRYQMEFATVWLLLPPPILGEGSPEGRPLPSPPSPSTLRGGPGGRASTDRPLPCHHDGGSG